MAATPIGAPSSPFMTLSGKIVDQNGLLLPQAILYISAKAKDTFEMIATLPVKGGEFQTNLEWKQIEHKQIQFKVRVGDRKETLEVELPQSYVEKYAFPHPIKTKEFTYKPHEIGFSLRYFLDIGKTAIPNLLRAAKEKLETHFHLASTADDVVHHMGSRIELTKESLAEFLINGVAQMSLKSEGDDLVGEIDWTGYEFDKNPDGTEQTDGLPNVKVFFTPNGTELPIINKIITQYRGNEPFTSQPGDSNFMKAMRGAACAGTVRGQIDSHLGLCHVFVLQIRNIIALYLKPDHGLGKLLFPHIPEVFTISDTLGEPAIYSDTGALGLSNANRKGIQYGIRQFTSHYDLFADKFGVPAPYQKIQRLMELYRGIVRVAMERFFDEELDEIVDYWSEVHTFFTALFQTSDEFVPPEGFVDDPTLPPREIYEGVLRSVRPIAKDPNGLSETDRRMLINFCTNFISLGGVHSFVHELGQIYLRDPSSFPVRVQNEGESVDRVIAIAQAQIIGTLLDFDFQKYSLLKNPNGDIYQPLIDLVDAYRQEFLDLRFDPENLMYTVPI